MTARNLNARRHMLLSASILAALGCGAEAEQPRAEEMAPMPSTPSLTPTEPAPGEEPDNEGLRLCCLLGAGCHPDSTDPPGGIVRRCHELGHTNQPEPCRAQYDECLAACNPTGMETEHACLLMPRP